MAVTTDFGPGSQAAFPVAAQWARRLGGPLFVLHVVTPSAPPIPPWPEWMARRGEPEPGAAVATDLEQRVAALDVFRGVDVRVRVLQGPVAREIERFVEQEDVRLVIMGRRARTGIQRVLLGGLTERVMRSVGSPLLLVREGDRGAAEGELPWPRRLLVAHDLAPGGQAALRVANDLARVFRAAVHLLHVLPADPAGRAGARDGGHEAAQDRMRALLALGWEGVSVDTETAEGPPATGILSAARAREADLIVIGDRPRTLLDRMLHDSVTEEVLRGTDRPVLVVPPLPAAEEIRPPLSSLECCHYFG